MAKDILTAKVAIVRFGAIEIEGLLFEDGRYGVAQQQAAALFSVIPTSAPKWLKSILGADVQLFLVKTDRNDQTKRQNRAENALLLLDFERLIVELGFEGNKVAQGLNRALVGLAITQIFSDSFGFVFNKADRQKYLASRINAVPDPWVKMYDVEFCRQVYAWKGSQFFWIFWCDEDGEWRDVWLKRTPPVAAKIGVLRHDFKEAVWGVAKFDSYCQRNKDGSLGSMWVKMPDLMIAKTAEAQALRKAFPQDLSGLYTPDEMASSDNAQPPIYTTWKSQKEAIEWAVQQTGLEREWLELEFSNLPAVNGKKAQAWVEFVGSCAK